MKGKVRGTAILAALGAAGCGLNQGYLRGVTAGQIGCPPDTIDIVDSDRGWLASNWTAVCRGRTYYCSKGDNSAPVACTRSGDEVAAGAQVESYADVSEQIGQPQIQAAMDRVRPQVLACHAAPSVKVRVSVAPDGSVANVEAGAPIEGTPAATCVERAVATAHFERARTGVVFRYTFATP
jgi:hypothetical protein